MVCTANDLLDWQDFPKGLRVLLLDEDSSSAAGIRRKLEEMDYIVSTFYNENEALSVISSKSAIFHVAIVEVNSDKSDGRLKFLETAKDLPTIMTSNMHSLTTMMKCIALGAVEFLQKPISEDKLRNIWQHVVHKAFNTGGKDVSESLKPVKESVVSMLNLQLGNLETKNEMSAETEQAIPLDEDNMYLSAGNKYPAPSTPQQKHGARLVDVMDCQDQNNFSSGEDNQEPDEESKSVEITYGNLVGETADMSPQPLAEGVVKEYIESAGGFTSEIKPFSPSLPSIDCPPDLGGNEGNPNKGSYSSSGTKANRKKMKVEWTPELHKKFVHAVERLSIDQAIPSRILELMKVDGLTRHNVASHLQKYRMHQRHILPKEDDRIWGHARESAKRGCYPYKPIMAFPPYHPNHPLTAGQVYHTWGSPSGYTAGVQMWSSPYYSPWQPLMHADAWGCPVLPLSPGPCPSFPRAEEVIDKVVEEAICKPWLPLPLGLKPPSTGSVLAELTRQGISTVPPLAKRPRRRGDCTAGPTISKVCPRVSPRTRSKAWDLFCLK